MKNTSPSRIAIKALVCQQIGIIFYAGRRPVTTTCQKKHACPDCRECQNCSPARCHLCRGQGAEEAERRFSGLSMAEQIALFEAVNRGERPEGCYHGRPQSILLARPE
jgi:hypothetical protein